MSFADTRSFVWAPDQRSESVYDIRIESNRIESYEKKNSIILSPLTVRFSISDIGSAADDTRIVLTLYDRGTGGEHGYPRQINYRTDISTKKTSTGI
jgi:hypothetical protein